MLVNLRQSRSVSAVVDAWTRGGGGGGGGGGADGEDKVNGRDGIGETDALRLGARAPALRRARRDGDDRDALRRDALDLAAAFAENDELDDDDEEKRATRVGFARCAAGLKTRADAAWLHAHVPKDIDVAAFVADDAASGNGYRARAIVAFARARGDLVETALAFSSRYGGDGDAVAVAVAVAVAARKRDRSTLDAVRRANGARRARVVAVARAVVFSARARRAALPRRHRVRRLDARDSTTRCRARPRPRRRARRRARRDARGRGRGRGRARAPRDARATATRDAGRTRRRRRDAGRTRDA